MFFASGNSKVGERVNWLVIGMSLAIALTAVRFEAFAASETTKTKAKQGGAHATPAHKSQTPAAKPAAGDKTTGVKKLPEANAGTAAKAEVKPQPVLENLVDVTPDDLVNKAHEYLNKNVKFQGDFSSFTSLALDYKPAFFSSKTHLSFLIFRPGSHVPLSELKLAMMVPKEKDPDNTLLQTLRENDQLELIGKVTAVALDEPWVEIYKVKKLNASAADDKKASADASGADKDKSAKVDETTKSAPEKSAKPGQSNAVNKPQTLDGKPGIKVVPGKSGKSEMMIIPPDVIDGKKPKTLPPAGQQPDTTAPPTTTK